jgi:uncharacterized membrane protein
MDKRLIKKIAYVFIVLAMISLTVSCIIFLKFSEVIGPIFAMLFFILSVIGLILIILSR